MLCFGEQWWGWDNGAHSDSPVSDSSWETFIICCFNQWEMPNPSCQEAPSSPITQQLHCREHSHVLLDIPHTAQLKGILGILIATKKLKFQKLLFTQVETKPLSVALTCGSRSQITGNKQITSFSPGKAGDWNSFPSETFA